MKLDRAKLIVYGNGRSVLASTIDIFISNSEYIFSAYIEKYRSWFKRDSSRDIGIFKLHFTYGMCIKDIAAFHKLSVSRTYDILTRTFKDIMELTLTKQLGGLV